MTLFKCGSELPRPKVPKCWLGKHSFHYFLYFFNKLVTGLNPWLSAEHSLLHQGAPHISSLWFSQTLTAREKSQWTTESLHFSLRGFYFTFTAHACVNGGQTLVVRERVDTCTTIKKGKKGGEDEPRPHCPMVTCATCVRIWKLKTADVTLVERHRTGNA